MNNNYNAKDKIEKAIQEIKDGKMVILVDDEDRENEGDLCMAAEKVTPEHITFMATYGRGLICLALTPERVEQLKLPMMVQNNLSKFGTAFTVSIEAREGVSTGISSADRAKTIKTAIDSEKKSDDLVSPGHVFPLRAAPGGVLQRSGQTEGSVDLARLAGLSPYGVICEVMKDDGTMARMTDLEKFAQKHNLMIVSIADIIQYRLDNETLIKNIGEKNLTIKRGNIKLPVKAYTFEAVHGISNDIFVAFVYGEISEKSNILCRVHTGEIFQDTFGINTKSSFYSIDLALKKIKDEGAGIILYILPKEANIKSSILGLEEVEENDPTINKCFPKFREIGLGSQVLKLLGVKKIILLTNTPKRYIGLQAYGLELVENIPLCDVS